MTGNEQVESKSKHLILPDLKFDFYMCDVCVGRERERDRPKKKS